MADRRRQVLQLLGSRFDGLYLPPGSLVTPAGLVPAVREPCASCDGVGSVVDRYRREARCSACGGAGWVARDPMDAFGVRVGSAATASSARPRRSVVCDACDGAGVRRGERCVRCDGEGRRDLHVFELHLDVRDVDERDPLLSAIERRNASGSYRELERGLVALWAAEAAAAVQLLACVDEQRIPSFEAPHYLVFERGLRFVVERMPSPIRVPAEVVANARERAEWRKRVKGRGTSAEALRRRDGEIRRALRGGVPLQRVAFEYALSVRRVQQIARGEVEAA